MDISFFHKPSAPSHAAPPPAEKEVVASPEMGQMDIHIMPEKFLVVKKQENWLQKRLLIGGGVIVVLGGGMGLAAWVFLRSIAPAVAPASTTPLPEETAPESARPVAPAPTPPVTSENPLPTNFVP